MVVVRLAVMGSLVRVVSPKPKPGTFVQVLIAELQSRIRLSGASRMKLFAKIFTTKTLLQIVFVLAATVMMKAMSAHYDFSWATALAQG